MSKITALTTRVNKPRDVERQGKQQQHGFEQGVGQAKNQPS
jgi:hypothetical protein